MYETGYQYEGFEWYSGKPGATCDITCKIVGMSNAEAQVGRNVLDRVCNLVNHFIRIEDGANWRTWTSNHWGHSVWTYGHFDI